MTDITAATALNQNDIWAVGYSHNTGFDRRIYTVHWDGSGWYEFATPEGIPGESQLDGIDASAPDDLWAVGHYTELVLITLSCWPRIGHEHQPKLNGGYYFVGTRYRLVTLQNSTL